MYIYKAGTGVGISVFGIWGDKVASILSNRHTVSKDVYMAILAHIVYGKILKGIFRKGHEDQNSTF